MELNVMALHSREEFQTYVATLEDRRKELEKLMGAPLGLDFASLDALEAFLLRRYRKPDAALALRERGVLDAAARHVGLVLVLGIDGTQWDIELDDDANAYYRLPIVTLPDGTQECPLSMLTGSLDRRTGRYMRGIAEMLEEDCGGPRTKKNKQQPKGATKRNVQSASKGKAKAAPKKSATKVKPSASRGKSKGAAKKKKGRR